MRSLFALLALSLALPACAQRVPTRQPPRTVKSIKQAAAAAASTEPVLVFQRTPCYGTCPAYTATIFADGRVEYEGQRFVKLLGKHTLQLPVATVNELLAEAKRFDFNKLQDSYKGTTTDMPTTLITVHPVGQPAKSVLAEENIPKNLQAYITYLNGKLDPLSTTLATE